MDDVSTELTGLAEWLTGNALLLLFGGIVLLFLYRGLRPWVHRALIHAMRAQRAAVGDNPGEQGELDRRVETIEDVVTRLLKAAVAMGVIAILLGAFNLWPALAGLGLVLAALTLAGQSIILDYLMGFLILTEGQYFKGDTVQINGITGVVVEVGLRRTQLRDVRGTLHSISNATVRQSANLTRTYGLATVEVDGVADGDVEAVIAVLDRVGEEMAADAEFDGIFLDTPGYAGTTRLTANGATLRLSGRVRPESRPRVEQEMRRRVAGQLAASGIQLIRPGYATTPGP
ncbi:MAG TPA: mechanosensitive ion channel domain-containing protein [Candidatus Limnocylindrales bacterium]|jgi:small conductance mechanosensitive channel|nr:mechanosensitive ion channel domain-containing protein [Candidatus Limnocylindrales bacterium]